jgi:hypothetical protein
MLFGALMLHMMTCERGCAAQEASRWDAGRGGEREWRGAAASGGGGSALFFSFCLFCFPLGALQRRRTDSRQTRGRAAPSLCFGAGPSKDALMEHDDDVCDLADAVLFFFFNSLFVAAARCRLCFFVSRSLAQKTTETTEAIFFQN